MEIKSNMVHYDIYKELMQEKNELKNEVTELRRLVNKHEKFILSLDPDNEFIPVEWDIREMQKEIESQKKREYEESLPY